MTISLNTDPPTFFFLFFNASYSKGREVVKREEEEQVINITF